MTLNSIIANFQTFKLADLLDIVIIAFLIYQLLGIINRTRAGPVSYTHLPGALRWVCRCPPDGRAG